VTNLANKLDYCPAPELLEKLGLAEDRVLIPVSRTFDSEASALAYCEEGGLLAAGTNSHVALAALEPKMSAVAVKTIEKLRGKAVELTERIKALAVPDPETGEDTWLNVMKQEIVTRAQGAKSKTRSCPGCPSAISVAHIKSFECPVCGCEEFLATTGDQDKIRSREDRLASARKELPEVLAKVEAEERKALDDSAEFRKVWLIFEGEQAETEPEVLAGVEPAVEIEIEAEFVAEPVAAGMVETEAPAEVETA
jgi:hypothetical protein